LNVQVIFARLDGLRSQSRLEEGNMGRFCKEEEKTYIHMQRLSCVVIRKNKIEKSAHPPTNAAPSLFLDSTLIELLIFASRVISEGYAV